MALRLVKPGTGVFQVRDGALTTVNGVSWTVWAAGRIYPPEGTYWVETSPGVNMEKRGTVNTSLTAPCVTTFTQGEYLLLQFMKDWQAVRVTPI